MSHASHDAMREQVATIRSLEEEEMNRPIGVLVDLQGVQEAARLKPSPSNGGRADLNKGDHFALDGDPALRGTLAHVYLPHPTRS